MYIEATVSDNVEIAEDIYNLYLTYGDDFKISPGQFIMLWIPKLEEVPMSPSLVDKGRMRITYKVVGETTRFMSKLKYGSKVYFRGPLGNGFDLGGSGRYLLIGGGVGVAPLVYAAHLLSRSDKDFTYVEGVPSSNFKMFIDEVHGLGGEAILYTEDGSEGFKGFPTDYLEHEYRGFDFVLACGPEAFNKKIYEICLDKGIKCQISMERLVKCGVGVCGSCVIENTGLLVCLDGPVFKVSSLHSLGYDC